MQQSEFIDVQVIWPDEHSVPVRIRLRPQTGDFEAEDEREEDGTSKTLGMAPGHYFDGAALEDFDKFLKRITRGEIGPVQAWCYEHLRDELWEALGIGEPVSGTVVFRLHDNG